MEDPGGLTNLKINLCAEVVQRRVGILSIPVPRRAGTSGHLLSSWDGVNDRQHRGPRYCQGDYEEGLCLGLTAFCGSSYAWKAQTEPVIIQGHTASSVSNKALGLSAAA